MRALMLFAMTALLVCFSVASRATEKITLYGVDDYEPYSYIDNGQLKGIYVDFIKQAAEKLSPDYEIEIVPIPWKRGLMYLKDNSIFALFPPYFHKERPYIQTYSAPLNQETIVLFCNDNVMQKPHDNFPDDYKGLTIGINLGYFLSSTLQEAAKEGKFFLKEAKGNNINIERLADKQIDCYVNDRTSVQYSMHQLKIKNKNKPNIESLILNEAFVLSNENVYISYSSSNAPQHKQDFIARMNIAIEELNKAGVMNELIHRDMQ